MLRPSDLRDAARAFEIRSEPAVSKMLSLARFPPSLAELETWFDDHPREWTDGEAFRFAILLHGRMIGLADLDDISVKGDEAEVGIWLDPAFWRDGYGSEAMHALLGFAFDTLGLQRLRAGHAEDNVGSARILAALGFRHVGDFVVPSLSRGEDVRQRRYILERPWKRAPAVRSCRISDTGLKQSAGYPQGQFPSR
ncbi:MAG: GNAT family N-acetyltransferase [Caulobacter sp.]|jgi:ribosomal-protein-alanine N-acetyltransferase|nr:GNAT family N-acetyltransferase [Caulobacter sp.]